MQKFVRIFKGSHLARETILATWQDVCDKMLNVIIAEPDVTFIAHLLESVHEVYFHLK